MNLLWLQSGGCGGCTLSWLGSEQGSLFRLLADEGIDILWHPSISEACLDEVVGPLLKRKAEVNEIEILKDRLHSIYLLVVFKQLPASE